MGAGAAVGSGLGLGGWSLKRLERLAEGEGGDMREAGAASRVDIVKAL